MESLTDTISSKLPMIRTMNENDIEAVVQVHMKSFSSFFLTFLGAAFLRELYAATLADPSGICFVAVNGKNICGFVTGTSQPSGFYRRLLQSRWLHFALASAIPVIKKPSIVPRLVRAFTMPEIVTQQKGRGTLMSIAVLPETQGKGIGWDLVRSFLAEAARHGVCRIDLTTDRNNSETTNRFYHKLGFTCERSFVTPEGRAMNEYIIDVVQP